MIYGQTRHNSATKRMSEPESKGEIVPGRRHGVPRFCSPKH